MKSATLKTSLVVTAVALLGSVIMTLFLAFFLYRDLAQIPFLFSRVGPAVVPLSIVIFAITATSLLPALRTISRIDKGQAVPEEERIRALRVINRISMVIIAENALAFFLGPAVQNILPVMTGAAKADWGQIALVISFSVSVGLAIVPIQSNLAEIFLAPEKRKLEILSFPEGQKALGIIPKFIYSSLSCVFFGGTSLAMAGVGLYREFAAWTAKVAADATSGATWAGDAAYSSEESFVLFQMLLIIAMILVFTGIAVWLSTATLSKQLKRLSRRMTEISDGSADLGRRAHIVSFDEAGRLASDFNAVLDSLKRIISDVAGLSSAVTSSSASLDGLAGRAENAVESMKGEFTSVQRSVTDERRVVDGASGVIDRLGGSIETVVGEARAQEDLVQRSSAAVTEMTANIASVSSSTAKAAELSERLSEMAAEGGKAVGDLSSSVAGIQEASASVAAIIGVISKIASQTNLLAMNAAIEAAHAGDAGAGFSVVADEVRGLAETSARSAKEIVTLVRAMDQKIKAGGELSARAGATFQGISALVADSSQLIQGIARSMSEQRQGTEEVLRTVAALTDASSRITRITEEQRALSEGMSKAMSDIVEAFKAIGNAVDRQGASCEDLVSTVSQVYRESESNARSTKALGQRIAGFKFD